MNGYHIMGVCDKGTIADLPGVKRRVKWRTTNKNSIVLIMSVVEVDEPSSTIHH
jgi:hypothetical protein